MNVEIKVGLFNFSFYFQANSLLEEKPEGDGKMTKGKMICLVVWMQGFFKSVCVCNSFSYIINETSRVIALLGY